MKQKIYQVDAFTHQLFSGNPAAVCPLEKWLDEATLQKIAMENNLSETAFYVRKNDQYEIRWFTPSVEVDLCGHATLAAAFVLFNYEGHSGVPIRFYSPRSGSLTVSRQQALLSMNFPADEAKEIPLSATLAEGFNIQPVQAFKGKTDYLFVFRNEADIKNLVPRFDILAKLECRGVIVTAKGEEADFVSRFFAPRVGVPEDPVTGSAHTLLTPFWAKRLNKDTLSALQLSARKGSLKCKNLDGRVEISGEARLYLSGEIFIPSC